MQENKMTPMDVINSIPLTYKGWHIKDWFFGEDGKRWITAICPNCKKDIKCRLYSMVYTPSKRYCLDCTRVLPRQSSNKVSQRNQITSLRFYGDNLALIKQYAIEENLNVTGLVNKILEEYFERKRSENGGT